MTPGVLHRDVLATGLEWAQPGYRSRVYTVGDDVWAFEPYQGVPTGERRWYRATVALPLIPAIPYVTVDFVEGREDLPLAFRLAGRRRTLFGANARTDLASLARSYERSASR